MRRFSKLKKRIESLFAPDIGLELHCTVYRRKTDRTVLKLPRLWITLDKVIIFDFVKDHKESKVSHLVHYIDHTSATVDCPIVHEDIIFITELIQEYIDTPAEILFDHDFTNDRYGLTEILRAGDRRIGKKRLMVLRDRTASEGAKRIIAVRLGIALNSAEGEKADKPN